MLKHSRPGCAAQQVQAVKWFTFFIVPSIKAASVGFVAHQNIYADDKCEAGFGGCDANIRGRWIIDSAAVRINNTEPGTGGTTVHAGGNVTYNSDSNLQTLPGTPPAASLMPSDNNLANQSGDSFFESFFGMSKEAMKSVANEVITCSGECNDTVNGKQGQVIWVEAGNQAFVLNGNTVVGSAMAPVVLIINGPVELRGTVSITGVVYTTADWANGGGGTATIRGVAISEGSFSSTGTPSPTYDSSVLQQLRRNVGTFLPVAGSWCDHCDWSSEFQ